METIRTTLPISNPSALVFLVAALIMSGCVSLGPSSGLTPGEHLNLAISYEYDGNYDLALREYQRAAVGPMRSRAFTGQGNVYLKTEQWSEAESSFRAALKEDPDNVIALNNLAWMFSQLGHSLDEAEQLIEHAIDLNPEPLDPYLHTLEAVREAR